MRTLTKEMQEKLSPKAVLDLLMAGNQRFINNLRLNRNLLQQVNETSLAQHPAAIVLSCIDSRTSVELIFDQGLGDVFSARIAGNVLNDDILGSMEYACAVAGAKLIFVLGHTNCGAITGAVQGVQMGHLTKLLEKFMPCVEQVQQRFKDRQVPQTEVVCEVARQNVLCQMEDILKRSSILRKLFNEGRIGIAAGVYSVQSGEVELLHTLFAN